MAAEPMQPRFYCSSGRKTWIRRLVVNGVLSAYIVVGTLLEERKLVHEFGETYTRYQERVSMFLPLKWLRSRVVG